MGMKRPTASVCIALCRGAVSSYPASICGRAPMRRGRPPCRAPTSRSPAIPTSRGSCRSRSSHPSEGPWDRVRRVPPVTGSLTTRLRSAALRLTAEIRHDFGRPPGSNVTRRSSGTTRQVSVRTLRGSRSGRSGVGRTSSGSILPNDSSTFRLPPDSRSSSEASVPVSQFHGRSGLSHPIHSPPPVAPQHHGLQLLRHMLANLSTLFFLSI